MVLACLAGLASAAPLFDVTSLTDNGLSTTSYASGTSNGVGFTFSGSIWSPRTNIVGGWQGFTGGNFVPAMPDSDVLHTGVFNPTFTFDQTISSALVYLGNDNGASGWWDFGVSASVVSGDVEVSGTMFRVTSSTGGIVALSGINSNVLSSPDIGDGNDFAIVVTPVPEPASMAVLGLGLAALRRRRG